MARELGRPADRVEGIKVLCLLHDMGKIAVSAEILNKPGKICRRYLYKFSKSCE